MHAVVDADKPGKPLDPEGLFLYKVLYYMLACPGPRVRNTQIFLGLKKAFLLRLLLS